MSNQNAVERRENSAGAALETPDSLKDPPEHAFHRRRRIARKAGIVYKGTRPDQRAANEERHQHKAFKPGKRDS